MNFLKFLLFFLVIYFDPIEIQGFKWAQIWKCIILILIFIFVKTPKKSEFSKLYFFLAFSSFISLYTIDNFVYEFPVLIKNLILPFTIIYFINSSTVKLNNLVRNYSVFIILSGIPFILNLIPEIGVDYDLSVFDISDDVNTYTGLFQRPHTASIITAYSTVVCFIFFKISKIKYEKYFLFFIFILGIYLSIKTYVRTGFLMVILGMLSSILYGKPLYKYFKFTPIIIVLIYFSFSYVSSNEKLKNRIIGVTKYQDTMNMNNISSGRLAIWESSLKGFFQRDNVIEIFLGLGDRELKLRNSEIIGKPYMPHNGFIEIFVTGGLMGIVIYLIFLRKWFTNLRQKSRIFNADNIELSMSFSIFFMYIIFMLFQGGHVIYESVFISYSIVMTSKSIIAVKNHKSLMLN